MSGKTVVFFLVLAASSASATTATVVYTRIFHPKLADTFSAGGAGASGQGGPPSAVVLKASEGFLGSFADYDGDSGVPACLSDSASCGSALQVPQVQILRSVPAFPPVWFGGDSQDTYTPDGDSVSGPDSDMSSSFERFVRRTIKRPDGQIGASDQNQPDGQTEASDQKQAQNDGGSVSSNSQNFPPEITAPSPPSDSIPDLGFPFAPVDQLAIGPINASESIGTPGAEPLAENSPIENSAPPTQLPWAATQVTGSVPEPSTWVMMLAGFAGLGFASYRGARKRVALGEPMRVLIKGRSRRS